MLTGAFDLERWARVWRVRMWCVWSLGAASGGVDAGCATEKGKVCVLRQMGRFSRR